nr:hypothetical protein TetV2_00105 [Oceanusvirus sp.]
MASFALSISKAIADATKKDAPPPEPIVRVDTTYNAPIAFEPVVEAPLSGDGGDGGVAVSDVSPDSAVTAYNVPVNNPGNGTVDLGFTGGGSSVTPDPGGLFGLPWEAVGVVGVVVFVMLICCCMFPGSIKALFKLIGSSIRSLFGRARSMDEVLASKLKDTEPVRHHPPPVRKSWAAYPSTLPTRRNQTETIVDLSPLLSSTTTSVLKRNTM